MYHNKYLSDILKNQAEKTPNKRAITFLAHDLSPEIYTYSQLAESSTSLSKLILGSIRSSSIILILPPGMDYIRSFWATILAGKAVIPLSTPVLIDSNASIVGQLQEIGEQISCTEIITTASIKTSIEDKLPGFDIYTLDTLSIKEIKHPVPISEIACYLFTSGSTSTPKGVILSHECIINNALAVTGAYNYNCDSTTVSWLPHFHAFGMLMNIIYPLFSGSESILFSAADFASSPLNWIEKLSAYKATHTGSPDFGYALAAKEGKICPSNLDLSRLSIAFSAGEPIKHESYNDFLNAYRNYGLKDDFLKPMYGMSEAGTICAKDQGKPEILNLNLQSIANRKIVLANGDTPTKQIVGCGKAVAGISILILKPDTNLPAEENEIGEICISGTSLFHKYINDTHNQEAFINVENKRFFKTGDLGFIKNEELFVTGRIKEVIILNGKNHYPMDIEAAISEVHLSLKDSRKAVFSIPDLNHNEVVIAVLEVPDQEFDYEEFAKLAAFSVQKRNGVKLEEIIFVPEGAMPRTGSGKLQRNTCKNALLQNLLPILYRKTHKKLQESLSDQNEFEANAVIKDLVSVFQEVFPNKAIKNTSLSLLEFDSIELIRITRKINEKFRIDIQLGEVISSETIFGLSQLITQKQKIEAIEKEPNSKEKFSEGKLSKNQQGLWIDYSREKNTFRYNTPLVFKLNKNTDLRKLELAMDILQDQYPILRARILELDTKPTLTLAEKKIPLLYFKVIDGSVVDYLKKKAWKPFSIKEFTPLFYIEVVIGKKDEKTLFINGSHLILDGKSCQIFIQHLQEIYNNLNTTSQHRTSNKEFNYFNFANWEDSYVSALDFQQIKKYWSTKQEYFEGLNLPYDSLSAVEASPAIAEKSLGKELEVRIAHCAKNNGVSKYSLLLSAYFVLLYKYTRQEKITVGTAFLNRPEEKFDNAMGYFSNILPVCSEVQSNNVLADYTSSVYSEVTQLLSQQSLPFPEIINILRSQGVEDDNLSFQAFFLYQDWLVIQENSQLLEEQIFEITQASIGDLTFEILSTESDLKILAKYNNHRFKNSTIEAMVDSYIDILEKIVQNPNSNIALLININEREQALLAKWNQTQKALPKTTNLFSFFNQSLINFPEKPAVISDSYTLTYSQLNEKIQFLSRVLLEKGIKKGSRIGLILPRNQYIPVAMMTCLNLGTIYIPLDPELPASRLEYILDHSKPDVLLSTSKISSTGNLNYPVLNIDHILSENKNAYPVIPSKYENDDTVYIIYTSGSTGKPKGVEVTYLGALNYHQSISNQPGISSEDTLLAVSTISFDIAFTEIIVPLLQGATICIASENEQKSGEELKELIKKNTISILQGTPTTFKLLLKSGWSQSTCLKKAYSTGEALPTDLAEMILATGVELWNMYGPTEATIETSVFNVTDPKDISIGKPLDNTRLYILDQEFNMIPPGASGELFIAGDCLAKGYLDQPELTQEKFISINNPAISEEILYRTGDLVRFSLDGNLYYLGRNDHQVKIRGYRIELKEIEHALKKLPSISDCCVAAIKSNSGGDELKALIIPQDIHSKPKLAELQDFLKNTLPAYMVPASFYIREYMPLLPNGKTDRHRIFSGGEDLNPIMKAILSTDGTTQLIASIWQEILGKPASNYGNTFFDEGGNSLLIPELQTQFRLHFPTMQVKLAYFFQYTTITAQAEWVKREIPPISNTNHLEPSEDSNIESNGSNTIVEAPSRKTLRVKFRTLSQTL